MQMQGMHPAIRDYDGFRELVEKNLQSSDFASAGKLVPLQGGSFINLLNNQSKLRSMVSIVPFDREKSYIELIDRSGRFLSVEAEGTDPVVRRTATPMRRELQPTRFIGIMEVTDWVYDIQIERETIGQTLMRIAADSAANDIDKLMLVGSETGIVTQDTDDAGYASTKWKKEDFLSSVDGLFQIMYANSNVVNFGSFATTHFSPMACAYMIRTLPDNRKDRLSAMRFFASPNHVTDYRFYMGQQGATNTEKWWNSLEATPKFHSTLIDEVPLLQEYPFDSKSHTFTSGGTVYLDHPPIKAASEHFILDQNGYQTPYLKDVDYEITYTNGHVKHLTGGNMSTAAAVLLGHQSSGVVVLVNPKNIYFAISRQDVELELWRDPIKGLNYFILRMRGDMTMGDYNAGVIGYGFGALGYSTQT